MSINISQLYESGQIIGWNKDIAEEEFDLIRDNFISFPLADDTPGRYSLFDIARKVLGKDTRSYAQQIGSCVAHGAKNAIEHLECSEIYINKDAEEFKEISTAYLYSIGRVQIGKGRIRGIGGSLGGWQSEAVMKYGVVPLDCPLLPKEDFTTTEKKWAFPPGAPKEILEIGSQHLIKSAARIKTWEEAIGALKNGYAITIASDYGFVMRINDPYGIFSRRGSWMHQMMAGLLVTGIKDIPDHIGLMNSWHDAHGRIKDLVNRDIDWPVGWLRISRRDFEGMMQSGEAYVYSMFQGFPKREIDWDEFKLF